jgi:hypothetical protein
MQPLSSFRWIPGKLVETREKLVHVWTAEWAGRDTILLDIALDNYFGLRMAALDKGSLSGDDLIELVALMLRNATIGAARFASVFLSDPVQCRGRTGLLLGFPSAKGEFRKVERARKEIFEKAEGLALFKQVERLSQFACLRFLHVSLILCHKSIVNAF